jgi:hypothetical protein
MIKFSTGLRDQLNGLKATIKGAIVGATVTLVDGGGGIVDTITHSGNAFVSKGFAPGDKLFVQGCTTGANDAALTGVVITSVAVGTLTLPTASVSTGEVFPAGGMIAVCKGGSLKDVMKDGKILVYSGSQPSSPDTAVASTLLLEITSSASAWVAGAFTSGLEFENDPLAGVMEKAAGETWSGTASASGTAGWFMFVANGTDALGTSTTLPRISGSIGMSGADLNISNTSIVAGRVYTIDEFSFTLPEYYGA